MLFIDLSFKPKFKLQIQSIWNLKRMNSEDESYTGPPPIVYSRISPKTKLKLYEKVFVKKMRISSAAKILKIKLSTAKMIISRKKKQITLDQSKNCCQQILSNTFEKNNEEESKQKMAQECPSISTENCMMYLMYFCPAVPFYTLNI